MRYERFELLHVAIILGNGGPRFVSRVGRANFAGRVKRGEQIVERLSFSLSEKEVCLLSEFDLGNAGALTLEFVLRHVARKALRTYGLTDSSGGLREEVFTQPRKIA
ncbi:MAG: hypothetical protein AAB460_02470 [Patescibacteria group bacterium]